MWLIEDPSKGTTNMVTVPVDGIISVTKPDSVTVYPTVNGAVSAVHHVHVKAGDVVHFKLTNEAWKPAQVNFDYNGTTSTIEVPAAEYTAPSAEGNIMTPSETINLFANPGMGNSGIAGGAGAGLGAGLLGGVLGGALLGGRGLLGGGAVGDVNGIVTPSLLAASLAQVTDTAQATTVLQTLGDIKASIPLAEGQVQLALAQSQAQLNAQAASNFNALQAQNNTNQTANVLGQSFINQGISNAIATSLASQADIKSTILTTAATNLAATIESRYLLTTQIRDDGDKTRALLIEQNSDLLNRELAVAQGALLEQRAIGRSRDVEVNVTQTVSQNQAQLQAQQQQQQQFLITNNLLQAILSQAQVAQATNQNLIIGNSGTSTTGAQTANPVNVRN